MTKNKITFDASVKTEFRSWKIRAQNAFTNTSKYNASQHRRSIIDHASNSVNFRLCALQRAMYVLLFSLAWCSVCAFLMHILIHWFSYMVRVCIKNSILSLTEIWILWHTLSNSSEYKCVWESIILYMYTKFLTA